MAHVLFCSLSEFGGWQIAGSKLSWSFYGAENNVRESKVDEKHLFKHPHPCDVVVIEHPIQDSFDDEH